MPDPAPAPAPRASLWRRIGEALAALGRGEGLGALLDRLRGADPAAPEHAVAFTIAILSLGAKMAKADGEVTRAEVAAFRRIFVIPAREEANAARVYDLARQDTAGWQAWAARIAALFAASSAQTLVDVLEALFAVAMADGRYHAAEDEMLAGIARIFAIPQRDFRAIRARHVEGAARDPYDVLGVSAFASTEEVRAAWKAAVREAHPDRLAARGLPREAVRLGERRLVAINAAWDEISALRAA